MNLANENINMDKKDFEKKINAQKFLSKNISPKVNEKDVNKIEPKIIINNNNLIKFINVSNTPNGTSEKKINLDNNINFNTPIFHNKFELKLNPEIEINKININNNYPKKENNNTLIKNISDKEFNINNTNSKKKEQNTIRKEIKYLKEENGNLNTNNFDNHKYIYINNSKEKNKNKINNDDNNDFIIYKNKKYKIEKIGNNVNNIKTNNYVNEIENKIKNDYNIIDENNNINKNKYFLNSFNERIEKIRETLSSINVIDILAEEVGLKTEKDEFNDNVLYEKAKILNKEFYDNLDVKLNEIETILNDLEKK